MTKKWTDIKAKGRPAERLARLHHFAHWHRLAIDLGSIEPKFGLATRRGSVGEHLKRRSKHLPAAQIAERIGRMRNGLCPRCGELAGPGEPRLLHLKRVVKHDVVLMNRARLVRTTSPQFYGNTIIVQCIIFAGLAAWFPNAIPMLAQSRAVGVPMSELASHR